MSLEIFDGFDHYSNDTNLARKWDSGSSANSYPAGRFAGNALSMQNSSATKTLAAVATRVVGFAYKQSTFTADTIIGQMLDAGTTQVELRILTTGALRVTRNGTTLGTSSAGIILTGQWYYIEWKVTINSSTGAYEVRLFGVNVLSGSGANTQNTGNATTDQVRIGTFANANLPIVDDCYVLNTSGSVNNDFLGECRVLTSLPTGDGASAQWTPSTGVNHWANVDEATPNDDTDYNSDTTVGHIDLYTFPSVSPTGAIGAVQTTMCARKDDAGTRQISEECRSGGTNFVGANTFTVSSTYLMYREIRETDPNTGIAWTNSGVNNAQFGVKTIA